MSYEKNTWNKGDVITANKLNHIEDGLADGGVLVVGVTIDSQDDSKTLDKTWQQIYDAAFAVICEEIDGEKKSCTVKDVFSSDETYMVIDIEDTEYTTDSPDGYPVSAGGK